MTFLRQLGQRQEVQSTQSSFSGVDEALEEEEALEVLESLLEVDDISGAGMWSAPAALGNDADSTSMFLWFFFSSSTTDLKLSTVIFIAKVWRKRVAGCQRWILRITMEKQR